MRIIHVLLSVAACTAIMTSSCRKPKTDNESTDFKTDKATVAAFMAGLKKAPQHFTVSAGVASKYKATEGTILEFYPNSFKDKNGNVITSGIVDVSITELYTPGDMIANMTATITNDNKVLTSGGEVNITATMNGEEVFANSYGLGFRAKGSAANSPMELYYGATNNDGMVTWANDGNLTSGNSVSGTTLVSDTAIKIALAPYYLFRDCVNFRWVNCDHPYDSTSKLVNINVAFPANAAAFENMSFISLYYPSLNIALNIYAISMDKGANTLLFRGYAPVGPNCKIVFSCPTDMTHAYYSSLSTGTTISDGMLFNTSPALLTAEEYKAKLNSL